MRLGVRNLMLLLSGLLLACINAPPFVCTTDTQCNSNPPGICVQYDKLQGSCAVPDTSCPSQYRYHESAQLDQIGKCATIPQFDIQTTTTKTSEHQDFALHVVVRDNAGQKLLNYGGTPRVLTNWGDVRSTSFTNFAAGEADLLISLNRETNDKDGPAYVLLQDGAAKGRSSPVAVMPPAWGKEGSFALSGGVKLSGMMSMVSDGSKFALVVSGKVDGEPVNSLYFAPPATIDQLRITTPFFTPPKNGIAQPAAPSLLVDNGHYLLTYTLAPVSSGKNEWLLYTSTDGAVWSTVGDGHFNMNSSLPNDGCKVVTAPQLLREAPGRYRLFYNSTQGELGVSCSAESSDGGQTWINATILTWSGAPMTFAIVAKEGSVYKTWSLEGAYATSGDGIRWVESKSEGQLPIGTGVYQEISGRYYGLFGAGSTQLQILSRL